MKIDIFWITVCVVGLVGLFFCFIKWKQKIYNIKLAQIIGAAIAIGLTICAGWRFIQTVKPHPTPQPLIYAGLAVVAFIALLCYLGAFKSHHRLLEEAKDYSQKA